jgi:hypothetical protein
MPALKGRNNHHSSHDADCSGWWLPQIIQSSSSEGWGVSSSGPEKVGPEKVPETLPTANRRLHVGAVYRRAVGRRKGGIARGAVGMWVVKTSTCGQRCVAPALVALALLSRECRSELAAAVCNLKTFRYFGAALAWLSRKLT